MAQAARLNLRLQKELKLLLTDPPPGASFPSLSSSSSVSLSSIEALIEGPEGTVYEKGLFTLKIQIPDRYPFHPPIVTFVTPIYHPNIDTGGRICLDILNLPPKGAWQPSLNISTILTSIGLLLCEPNPDDGLMHEASKEFKYNKQAFDHKARSMTEKYARIGDGATGALGNQNLVKPTREPHCSTEEPNMLQPGMIENNHLSKVKEHCEENKTLFKARRKLSLESCVLQQENDKSKGDNGLANFDGSKNDARGGATEQVPRSILEEYDPIKEESQWRGMREYLECAELPNGEMKDDTTKCLAFKIQSADNNSLQFISNSAAIDANSTSVDKLTPSQYPGGKETSGNQVKKLHAIPHRTGPQISFSKSSHNLQLPPAVGQTKAKTNEVNQGDGGSFVIGRSKKLGLPGRKLSLVRSHLSAATESTDNKENLSPNKGQVTSHSNFQALKKMPLMLNPSDCHCAINRRDNSTDSIGEAEDDEKNLLRQKPNKKPANCQYLSGDHRADWKLANKDGEEEIYNATNRKEEKGSPVSESVIVLDSEDSEDERSIPLRSRLSLSRKCLPSKRKQRVDSN